MKTRFIIAIGESTYAAALAAQLQPSSDVWLERTSWGDPDLQGEWTSEGEFGVRFERPPQFGTRRFLTDEEYAERLEGVRARDERDLAPVDVLSGNVEGASAPIPHWREYNTTSRRTSLVVDPADGRFPPRTPQSAPFPVPQRCGSLQRGEPCDSYRDYNLGVRCIVHGGGFPDAMFPAVYNANLRIIQSPGYVVVTYELIHDTRIIALDSKRSPLSPAIRKLEAELRVPIGRRSNRFIGFTHEGERIVAWAQRVLAEHDTLVDNVRSLREGLSGRLRIGAIPTTLSSIALITSAFCERHPMVTLSIASMTSNEIQRGLADYQIDIGLTYVDNEPLEHVRKHPVYRERYALLTAEHGLLADHETITWAEAAEVPLCLLSSDMQNRRIIDQAFRQAGVEAVPKVETNSVSALCSYVKENRWSAVMPHAWLALHSVPEGMRAIPLVEPGVSKQIGLVVADRDPEPILARALLDTLSDTEPQARIDRYHPSGPAPEATL